MSELGRGLRGRFCRRHYLQICLALTDVPQSTGPETPVTDSTPTPMDAQRAPEEPACAPADDRECGWTTPWLKAAQNANWCVPEVRP